MTDTNKERAEFESWLAPAWSRDTFADDDGDTLYVEDWVQGAWMMFCHNRASLAAKAPAAPTGWYALAADGMATLCVDRDDAEKTAADSEKEWPNCGPFRAVQLYTAPPQGAPITDAEQAAWHAGLDEGRSQVRAPLQQGEYLPLPEPDTHCYDEDTGKDVWSYSASQMHAAIDADRAARGAAQAAPAPVTDGAVKALHDAMADCRKNGITIDASVMGFFCNRLNEQPAPVAEGFDEWLEKQFEFRNYYFDLRGPGLMAIPFARRAYEAGRAQAAQPEGGAK